MSSCYFCHGTERLESHHIVPRRFDGDDTDENLVDVCPTCHSKLEHLYDSRFYSELGVEKGPKKGKPCVSCSTKTTHQVFNGMTAQSFFVCKPCYQQSGYAHE